LRFEGSEQLMQANCQATPHRAVESNDAGLQALQRADFRNGPSAKHTPLDENANVSVEAIRLVFVNGELKRGSPSHGEMNDAVCALGRRTKISKRYLR